MNKRLRKKLTKKLLASPMTDKLNWAAVLRSEPEKAAQCPVLKQFDGIAWWWILIRQPQLDYLCNWKNFKGNDWSFLLGFMPQYADKCRWNKLEGMDWRLLLLKQPQFAKYCNIEKLGIDDCKKLLEPASGLDDITKAKITERLKQFKYRIGFLDGYWLPSNISQCGRCRFLMTDIIHQCLYFPAGSPNVLTDSYWMNRVNCPHRADRSLPAPEELHKFAIKYAVILQNSPTEIQCSEFSAELLLHSSKADRCLRINDQQEIYAETDIKLITSMISTKWFWERKHDFQWFVSALLHLAKLTSMYKNKEVAYE